MKNTILDEQSPKGVHQYKDSRYLKPLGQDDRVEEHRRRVQAELERRGELPDRFQIGKTGRPRRKK